MAIKIVHFGSDNFNRIATLKSCGYSIDECNSLAQLHASLVGILPADAVAIAENIRNDDTVQDYAVSLVRAITSIPLILFGNGNHDRVKAEFDLVVPSDAQPDKWLSDLAELIAHSSRRNL